MAADKNINQRFLIISLLIFLIAMFGISRYQCFGDAMEVITGGWFISQGLAPYRDFFFHKMPLMYILSVPLHLLGLKDLLYFRVFLFCLYAGLMVLVYQIVPGQNLKKSLLILMLIFPFTGAVFMNQMWLTNNLSGLAALLAFITVRGMQKNNSKANQLFIFLFFIAFNTSLTSFFSLVPLVVYWFIVDRRKWQHAAWLLATNMIFPAYFLIRGYLSDFLSAALFFSNHYFQYRIADAIELRWGKLGIVVYVVRHFTTYVTESSAHIMHELNSLRLASIFLDPWLYYQTTRPNSLVRFVYNYGQYAYQLSYNFFKNVFTFEHCLLIGIVLFIVSLIQKRQYAWAVLALLFAVGARARTNEIFQLAPYYLFSFWVLGYLWVEFARAKEGLGFLFKLIISGCLLAVLVVGISRYYQIMQTRDPAYYVHARRMAEKIQAFTDRNDKIWIFGGEAGTYFWAQRLPANPYYFYYPVINAHPEIHHRVASSIMRQDPALLIFSDLEGWQKEGAEFYAADLARLVEEKYRLISEIYYRPDK